MVPTAGWRFTWLWLVSLLLAQTVSGAVQRAAGPRGAVAAGAREATEAGLAAMQRGGNAVDAAVATALTLGVVDGHNSGVGGGCFLLIRRANGSLVAIDGRETAPAAATEQMFVRDGQAVPELSRTGALAVGVPGALAAYDHALRQFGRLPWRQHLEAAARVADQGFDLRGMTAGSADFVHLLGEAMKRAFADRAYWLGDPDFTFVPRGLVAKTYAAELARDMRLDAVTPVAGHGDPEAALRGAFGRHTTHFSTADAAGNWVAGTATLNTSFGSKVIVPGTGIVLNNQMDDFSAQPGATNSFGLPGAAANAVAPGKRPLSSMSPTIVLKAGQPILAVGASGGPTIISQTVLALVNTLDAAMDLPAALCQPRFHHQWRPDELQIEPGISPEVRRELERRGHRVIEVRSLAATQAVAVERGGGGLVAVADPRARGQAAAW